MEAQWRGGERVACVLLERVVAMDPLLLKLDTSGRRRYSASSLPLWRSGCLPRAVVTERRRLCTTPCIFGTAVLRTASMNLARGCIGSSGDLGDRGDRGERGD